MEGSLILANGEKFTGQWHGNHQDHIGELVFYTGMGRFQEFITDPANQGKIIVATFPGILNSELDKNRFESEQIQIGALIIQQDNDKIKDQKVYQAFVEQNIPILSGMDTRAIVKRVKKEGEMPAIVSSQHKVNRLPSQSANSQPAYKEKVVSSTGNKHIVIINFGYKKSLVQQIIDSDFKVTVVSNETDAKYVDSLNPDGIVFSGGPGSPLQWEQYFPAYKALAKKYPTIGIGLGHQVLALVFGATIEKMPTGHRNFKEAVIQTESNKVYMSNQNHGYAIAETNLNQNGWEVSFKNVNDGTVEGLTHNQYAVATFQFHPEQISNALNEVIFNNFFQLVNESKGARVYA